MQHNVKKDKAIIMCGLAGIIIVPILAGSLVSATTDTNDLTNRFLMIVAIYVSAPFGALVGGFIGWLGGKVAGLSAE